MVVDGDGRLFEVGRFLNFPPNSIRIDGGGGVANLRLDA